MRLTVHDVTDSTCSLKWLVPEKVGAGGLDGYIIEYCKEGGDEAACYAYCVKINIHRQLKHIKNHITVKTTIYNGRTKTQQALKTQIPLIVIYYFIVDTEWVAANKDLCERQGYVVRGLPVGEKINFRVVAVNIAGRSPPATLGQPVTIREIVGELVDLLYYSAQYGLMHSTTGPSN